jgi:hypothetical protein
MRKWFFAAVVASASLVSTAYAAPVDKADAIKTGCATFAEGASGLFALRKQGYDRATAEAQMKAEANRRSLSKNAFRMYRLAFDFAYSRPVNADPETFQTDFKVACYNLAAEVYGFKVNL